MVEIGHQDLEAFAFLADDVLDRDFDVLEVDPRRASCPLQLTRCQNLAYRSGQWHAPALPSSSCVC